MTTENNQNQDEHVEGDHINEFELTDAEKAELAALDAQNGDSDEVKQLDGSIEDESELFDDIEIDETALNNQGGNNQENTEHNDNPDNNNPEHGANDGNNGDAGNGNDAGAGQNGENNNDNDIPPPKDYSEELEELDQQKQEADGKVQDILDQLKELADKYDDGDIAQGKYDFDTLQLKRQLGKQEAAAERIQSAQEDLLNKANTEAQSHLEKQQQVWLGSLRNFIDLPENELIKNNPNVANKFDQILSGLNDAGVLDGLTQSQVLATVRTNLAMHFPELNSAVVSKQKEDPKKPPKPSHEKVDIPLSLANQQTLEVPDQTDPFAYIRKLSGIEYEKAIAALDEQQLNQFYS